MSKPVIRNDLTNQEYHDADGISSTFVKKAATQSLAHAKHGKGFLLSTTADLGTAVHAMVLEAERDLVIRGGADRRGNKWKELRAQAVAEGKTLLTDADYDRARAMSDSLLNHPSCGRLLEAKGPAEASLFATHKSGLRVKARPDKLSLDANSDGIVYNIVDVKTALDASPYGFQRQCFSLGYDLQAYHYTMIAKACGIKVRSFVFAAVEKEPPYAAHAHIVSNEVMQRAERIVNETLEQIAQAEKSNHYPTGWSDYTTIQLPSWIAAQEN